ncbi:MAG: replicative DNA helicase [Kiritimatiellia bacterium]|jgi:replicative DNA helicase|nr:replicative DNA helicase [Kiritimatiellia bacterium]
MAGAAQASPGARALRPGERVPPHSEDAERAVLGCALQDASRILDLCIERQITVESFYVQTHQALFETMLALYSARKPVDLVTVVDRLRENRQLDGVGGEEELARLIDGTPTTAHADYYIQLVYENHLMRRIIDAARIVTEEVYKGEQEAESLLGFAEESFYALSEQRVSTERTFGKLIEDEMKEVEKLISEKKGITGLSTGFERIDEMLLGMQNSDLIVLAARPSMGKTSLALNIAENVALGARHQTPVPVAVFSLEMSGESLVRRMICCHAGVASQDLSRGKVGQEAHGKLIAAADTLRSAPIYLDDTAGLEALDLRARARRLKRKYGIRFIVVDYLQLMNFSKFAMEGRQRETAAISQALKGMAKELKVPVLVLSQLSRAPETRDSKSAVPKLSDLRDSGAIEQDADVVMLLRRPSRYKQDQHADDTRLAILDIAKHRNGPVGEIRLDFEESFTRFSNRYEGIDPEEG